MQHFSIADRTIHRDGLPVVKLTRWEGERADTAVGATISGADMDETVRHIANALNVVSPAAAQLLAAPMVDWRAEIKHISPPERSGFVDELDALIVYAARLRAYIGHAGGGVEQTDDGHARCVKASNRLASNVRRALGFAYPKLDVLF